MIQRCENPNTRGYFYYGARGITVCARWRNSFEAFLADMGEPPERHTLDRIDNDGIYEPGNCRWATLTEQLANRRSYRSRSAKRFVELHGFRPDIGLDGWPLDPNHPANRGR
jgi:hypothetical protein